METYHLRRQDKALDDDEALFRILSSQRYVTIAMCRGGEPYLVNLNHGFDRDKRRIYFHCAPEGKKIDFLRSNPKVWGQVVEDLGYIDGECDHAYRSVMFSGRVGFLETIEDKRTALEIMIRQQESRPEPVIERTLESKKLAATCVGFIDIEEISGKESTG
jgi:nitroimidazol reductase NimA-like FMN-containing flavoprotein (pyridoxamine 5'-phosphate oxidase superfamily)